MRHNLTAGEALALANLTNDAHPCVSDFDDFDDARRALGEPDLPWPRTTSEWTALWQRVDARQRRVTR